MKKLFLILVLCLFNLCAVYANPFKKVNPLSYFVQSFDNDSIISTNNENKLYENNATNNFTKFLASYYTLGDDFEFKTSIYKDNQNNLYIKLSADPLLAKKDLVELFKDLKTKFNISNINNIYIDDTVIINDSAENITPYIIDNNKTTFAINRSSLATKADIIQNDDYKTPVINKLKIGQEQKYTINIQNIRYSPMWVFQGTVAKDEVVELPVLKPEINFKTKLYKSLEKNKIEYFKGINAKPLPKDAKYLTSVGHSLKEVSKNILYKEDELCINSVFYIAGAKYTNYSKTAGKEDAYNMLDSVLKSSLKEGYALNKGDAGLQIDAKALCDLTKYMLNKTKLIELLPQEGNGSLKERFYFLKDNLKAYSSQNDEYCATIGILKTKKGQNVVFSMLSEATAKNKTKLSITENELITKLYRKN